MAKYIESFLWGILAALGALVVEIVFYIVVSLFVDSFGVMSFSHFFVIPKFIIAAACIEEILKYLLISKRFSILPPEKSRLINAFLIGLGFFLFELVIILTTRISPAPQFLIEIAILHIGTASLIGLIITAKAIKRIPAFVCAIIAAVIFHSSYNLLTSSRNTVENYLIFTILGLFIIVNVALFLYLKRLPKKQAEAL